MTIRSGQIGSRGEMGSRSGRRIIHPEDFLVLAEEPDVSVGVITLSSGCVLVSLRELYYFSCAVEHGIMA